ncbi:MAG: glycyl-radical enzyme activating protein [Oscillospiraceae bacterium]|nr:glycyl-radical enzyme activating protein [Oscillospiraceae bacterium]
MKTGIIADIQRFSLHDGPGIRTSVFVKGCNMRCAWCHNPETIAFEPEILLKMENCIGCGQCEKGCFAGAKVLCGQEMTVEEVLAQVMLDAPYYGETGGITITGGEPACQAEFCAGLLRACRENGIHTAIETNLCFNLDTLRPMLSELDLVMADIKLFDDAAHRQWTGVGNGLLMDNLAAISGLGIPLIVRTPVVPGVNATEEDIEAIAAFASGLPSLVYYELLPYHSLGLSKGKAQNWAYAKFDKPEHDFMLKLGAAAARRCGSVCVAGQKIAG